MVSALGLIQVFCSVALLIGKSSTVASAIDGTSNDHAIAQDVLKPHVEADVLDSQSADYSKADRRPIYAIAHRVLTVQGVKDAVSNGANAIEIDMYAWKDGWWADHDGTAGSAGDTAKKMFETIVEQRKAGKTITFVWLDIKNPDYCDPDIPKWRHCSVANLRDLARGLLEPQGVRVLFGFYKPGKAFGLLRSSLSSNEGINLNGLANYVLQVFQNGGPYERYKRVMSYGYYNLPFQFSQTLAELRQAVQSQGFGKVFGWTSAAGQSYYVDKVLSAGVDGLIYGFMMTYYYDHPDTRSAARDIIQWVQNHPQTHRMATQSDKPW